MAQYTININNCGACPISLPVKVGDLVQFCTQDSRSYQLTGLGNVFQDVHGQIDVPANGCSPYYLVNGSPGKNKYNIGPNCPHVEDVEDAATPDIIIEN